MSATMVRDLGRTFFKPRFLIAIIISMALITMTVHRQHSVNEEYRLIHRSFEANKRINKYFSDTSDVSKSLRNSERLYQLQVQKRNKYIRENNSKLGAWYPHAKEMMPFWWYFQPSFNCPYEVERVGRFNDGGKWMCGMSVIESFTKQDNCVIYSLGVFDDSSWEKEMLDRTNCQVYAFDASVDRITGDAANHPNMHFFKYFIGGKDKIDSSGTVWKTLKTIMKENGHDWIDVLKIDIEGNEFDALNAMMDQFYILPFSQLQLEIHVWNEGKELADFKNFLKFWERLESHHLRPFWSELNTIVTKLSGTLGLSEYSFLNIGEKKRLLQN
ncbi:hypothetical protein FBU30_000839 [Linnemannia zychae]|nr:hypothetical protein FBU30_000839 [Linnemannia zychae]